MQVNMHEAKAKLSELTALALQGETVVVAKAGQPLVMLVPYVANDSPRKAGRLKGQIELSDDFNDSDSQVESMFCGGEL